MPEKSLVSVIIPCYNQTLYLRQAIQSVLDQSYPKLEIIVVDDGSTENVKKITDNYPEIRYVRQNNKGLSAARNTGIRLSNGEFLLFLDADDWLYPAAIETNLGYMQKNSEAAIVSGAYEFYHEDSNRFEVKNKEIIHNDYLELFRLNFTWMISAHLFRRWIFDKFLFDESLKSSEDHDLYLFVARDYKIIHHDAVLAVYRRHRANMTNNYIRNLQAVLRVLNKHRKNAVKKEQLEAYNYGVNYTKKLFGKKILNGLRIKFSTTLLRQLFVFSLLYPRSFSQLFVRGMIRKIKSVAKQNSPNLLLRFLHQIRVYKMYIPAVNKVKTGDFERTNPFSRNWGFDRGGAIDRYYIEKFLRENSSHISGRVLEIDNNNYTLEFGGSLVLQSDVLDINKENHRATIHGDLQDLPLVQDNTFDCIILTQTLQLIFDCQKALDTCFRILKPGGTLLLTVPGITPLDHESSFDIWCWSFTEHSIKQLLEKSFPESDPEIETFGNVYVASAFLYGMGIREIPKEKLDIEDRHFPVIITAKITKPKSS